MPSDVAIQELLYAILKQKCLKDIDWNKVAADPILTETITNGHAARMRYARFKKQMETARANIPPDAEPPLPSPRRGRNPATKRLRVGKIESPKKTKRGSAVTSSTAAAAAVMIKKENIGTLETFTSQATGASSSFQSHASDETLYLSEREGTEDSTADIRPGMSTTLVELSRIKRERLSHTQTSSSSTSLSSAAHLLPNANAGRDTHAKMLAAQHLPAPLTPITTPRYCVERSASPSPSLCQGQVQGQIGSFDTGHHYMGSFEGVGRGLPPLFGEESYEMGLGMGMGLGDMGLGMNMEGMGSDVGPFDEVWGSGEERVAIKVEPRWEDAYRH